MDGNMGAERDANLHQPARELERIRDAKVQSLHFTLLFPHGELGWHLADRSFIHSFQFISVNLVYKIWKM